MAQQLRQAEEGYSPPLYTPRSLGERRAARLKPIARAYLERFRSVEIRQLDHDSAIESYNDLLDKHGDREVAPPMHNYLQGVHARVVDDEHVLALNLAGDIKVDTEELLSSLPRPPECSPPVMTTEQPTVAGRKERADLLLAFPAGDGEGTPVILVVTELKSAAVLGDKVFDLISQLAEGNILARLDNDKDVYEADGWRGGERDIGKTAWRLILEAAAYAEALAAPRAYLYNGLTFAMVEPVGDTIYVSAPFGPRADAGIFVIQQRPSYLYSTVASAARAMEMFNDAH